MKLVPIILLLLAGVAVAEDEPTVLERLKSDSPGERAWGAYLAGRDGVADAVPLLTEMIRTVPEYKDKTGRLVVRAAFDALIRLKLPVRAEVLKPHLSGYFGTPALILLTRSPEALPEALLPLFGRYGSGMMGGHGIAVGNLLCKEKVPGFAARLLRGLKLDLNVSIVDQGFGGRGGSHSLGVSAGDGRLNVPEGFPPVAIYLLTDRERPDSVLLADGPRPIRWYRIERKGPRVGFGSVGSRVDFKELAREWLAVLSGIPVKEQGIPETSSTSLVWSDGKTYLKHVTARRDAILARYWKLVAALMTKEVLALDEALALKPKVTVTVHDSRKKPGGIEFPELPAPPERPRLPGEEPEAD